jgi:hypothetical protein
MLTTALIGAGLSALFGFGGARVITRGERRSHNEVLADKDRHIATLGTHLADAKRKIADTERKHGRATAEIAALKPLAEKGQQAIDRQKKLAIAGNRASHAARAAKKAAQTQTPTPLKVVSPSRPRTKKKAAG